MNRLQVLLRKKLAYQRMFLRDDGSLNEDGRVVIADLMRFCRAQTATLVVSPKSGTVDPLASAALEGRREVFNRIAAHLHIKLSDAAIAQLAQTENENE